MDKALTLIDDLPAKRGELVEEGLFDRDQIRSRGSCVMSCV